MLIHFEAWGLVRDWLQLVHIDTAAWALERSTKDCWINMSEATSEQECSGIHDHVHELDLKGM